MATKVTGANQKLVFNAITYGTGGSCLGGVEYSDTADSYLAKCAAGGYANHVVGLRTVTATVNVVLDDVDHAVLNAAEPGDSAADYEHHPAGDTATFIEISASLATVLSRTYSVPVEGLTALTFVLGLDSFTAGAAT